MANNVKTAELKESIQRTFVFLDDGLISGCSRNEGKLLTRFKVNFIYSMFTFLF